MNLNAKASLYKALSEPIRLRILSFTLRQEESPCICDIAKEIKKDQSVAFRHIEILRAAGLIEAVKKGKRLLCSIPDKQKARAFLEG
ncbi:TPA: winged helix-turn-helix transcriptional regulator [Candidatus Woesearchaeota archaeon]|nr:winged helix-turn-helix transcriptional regulator [Candidatus Woesearchaeota archaeon]